MCLVAAWLLAIPAATHAVEFTRAGDATRPAQTDVRYAAWPELGQVGVLDTRTGRTSRTPTPPGCEFVALGAGRLLWDCGYRDGSHRGRVLQIATGAVTEVAVFEGDFRTSLDSVGSYWIHGTTSGNHYSNNPIWTRIDGSDERGESKAGNERQVEDLSHPALVRPLCAPLARERDPDYDGEVASGGHQPFFPYQYEKPFGLRNHGAQILLSRCGHSGSRILDRRGGGAQLLAGWVTWVRGWQVRGYFPARKRRAVWDVDLFDPSSEVGFEVRHTKRHLVVSALRRDGSGWRIVFARVR